MTLTEKLLLAARRHPIREDDAASGIARLRVLMNDEADEDALRAAVAAAVEAGLLHDPVRLEPGALQCHWRLDLAPAGFAAAQKLLAQAGET